MPQSGNEADSTHQRMSVQTWQEVRRARARELVQARRIDCEGHQGESKKIRVPCSKVLDEIRAARCKVDAEKERGERQESQTYLLNRELKCTVGVCVPEGKERAFEDDEALVALNSLGASCHSTWKAFSGCVVRQRHGVSFVDVRSIAYRLMRRCHGSGWSSAFLRRFSTPGCPT